MNCDYYGVDMQKTLDAIIKSEHIIKRKANCILLSSCHILFNSGDWRSDVQVAYLYLKNQQDTQHVSIEFHSRMVPPQSWWLEVCNDMVIFVIPVNMLKGDIETVSVRL